MNFSPRNRLLTWYLGGLSARQPRELALPLSFLGAGRYTMRIWKDAPDAEADPNHLTIESLNLSSAETLIVRAALDGGFVAELEPARN